MNGTELELGRSGKGMARWPSEMEEDMAACRLAAMTNRILRVLKLQPHPSIL